jgi:hypothetical protein
VPHDYVRAVLSAYLALPDTPCRTSPFDRRLARDLYQRAVPLATVTDAFSLAIARRRARPLDSVPLGSIRSIAYFLPLIDELVAQPLEPAYAAYLRRKILNDSVQPLA